MSVKSSDFILMFLSLVFGTMYGEYCSLDKSITNFTEKIKIKINVKDAKFTDGIVTAFLLFCIGSMTIVGAIDEGLGKTPDILYTKSVMDGISSIILASAFGIGVLFSVFPMLLFQGGITILVFYYKDFLPIELIDHVQPQIIVNFAAQGMVAESWLNPTHWYKTNTVSQVALHDELRKKTYIKKYVN